MDGFVRSVNSVEPMGYWTEECCRSPTHWRARSLLANRWFCSAPCQTYPNRRFLMAGTAYGNIATDNESLKDPPPPNGTIWDRLHAYGVSWRNYFTDLPQTGIIPSIVEKYPANIAPIAQFYLDCAAGTLPSVSFVDPEFGVLSDVGAPLATVPRLGAIGGKAGNDRAATRRTRRTCPTASTGRTRPSRRSFTRRRGRAPCSSTPTTSTAATTTTSPRPRRSHPTRSRPNSVRATCRAAMTSMARAFRRSWLRRMRSPTRSPTWCTTTPRCWRRSRPSGTCPRSPTATPTRRRSRTSSIRGAPRSSSRPRSPNHPLPTAAAPRLSAESIVDNRTAARDLCRAAIAIDARSRRRALSQLRLRSGARRAQRCHRKALHCRRRCATCS